MDRRGSGEDIIITVRSGGLLLLVGKDEEMSKMEKRQEPRRLLSAAAQETSDIVDTSREKPVYFELSERSSWVAAVGEESSRCVSG